MLLISPGVGPITYNVTGEVKATHRLDGTISVSTTVDLPDDAARDIDVGWTLSYVNSKKEIIPCKVVSVSHNSSGDNSSLDISCIDRASFNAQKFAGKSTFGSSTEGHTAREYFDWVNSHFTGSSSSGLDFNVEYHGSDDTPHYVSIGNSTAADALSAIIKDGGYEAISDGNTIHIYDNIRTGNYRVFSSDILMSQCTFEQDASSLITVQDGTGKDGITATYTSPLADKYGLLYGAPVNDDSIATVEKLQAKLKANVEATYAESVTATYANDAGYNLDNAQIGDIINFVDPISGLHIAKRCIQIDYTYDDRGQVSEGSLTAGKPDAAERTAQSLQDLANAAEEYANNTGSDLADDLVSMGGDTGIGDIGNDMYGNLGDAGGSGLNGGNTNGDGSASSGVKNSTGSGEDWSTKTKKFRFFRDDDDYSNHENPYGNNDYDRVGVMHGNGTYVGGESQNSYNTDGIGDWSVGGMWSTDREKLNGNVVTGSGMQVDKSARLVFFPRSSTNDTQGAALLGGGQLILATQNKDHGGSYSDDYVGQIVIGNTVTGSYMNGVATKVEFTTTGDGDGVRGGIAVGVGFDPQLYVYDPESGSKTWLSVGRPQSGHDIGHVYLNYREGDEADITNQVDLVKLIEDHGWWDTGENTTTTTTKSVDQLAIETIHDAANRGQQAITDAGALSGATNQYLQQSVDDLNTNKDVFNHAFDLALYLNMSSSSKELSDVKYACDQELDLVQKMQTTLSTIGQPALSDDDQAIYARLDTALGSLNGAFSLISETIDGMLAK